MRSLKLAAFAGLVCVALGAGFHQIRATHAEAHSLLLNGNLSEWTGSVPNGWVWLPESPLLSRLSEERRGNPVISIRQPNNFFQDVSDKTLRAGDRVVFEGFFRTGEANRAFPEIRVWYRDPGAERPRVGAGHRVSVPVGGWQYMRLMAIVPEDGPDFVRFSVSMNDEMQSPLLVSGLRAYVVPEMP